LYKPALTFLGDSVTMVVTVTPNISSNTLVGSLTVCLHK